MVRMDGALMPAALDMTSYLFIYCPIISFSFAVGLCVCVTVLNSCYYDTMTKHHDQSAMTKATYRKNSVLGAYRSRGEPWPLLGAYRSRGELWPLLGAYSSRGEPWPLLELTVPEVNHSLYWGLLFQR